jgi:hypothetical protein
MKSLDKLGDLGGRAGSPGDRSTVEEAWRGLRRGKGAKRFIYA